MKAISSMATRRLLADLTRAAASEGFPAVEVESVGGVVAAQRVAAGERFDLVFLAADALDRLAADGRVDPASVTPLVISQVAVAVPSHSPDVAVLPEGQGFANGDEVRELLRSAGRVGYSTGPSGAALIRAIDGWGVTDELANRLVQARPGVPVARSLAEGEVDLGFQQLSELVGQPGVRILGVVPEDCGMSSVFSGAVATSSALPDDARELLAYLTSPDTAAARAAHHFVVP